MQQTGTVLKDIKVQKITPATAMKMLLDNHSNRPLRKGLILSYAEDMKRGNWQTTHQGIAFNAKGELIDGQHRLYAIIESNIPQNMLVATYTDNRDVFGTPIDLHSKRTMSDLMGENKRTVEILSFIDRELLSENKGRLRLSELIKLREKLAFPIAWWERTIGNTSARTFSCVAIRSAVFTAYAVDNSDWSEQYDALVNLKLDVLDSCTAALFRKFDRYAVGKINLGKVRKEMFSAVYMVASNPGKHIKTFTPSALDKAWEQASEGLKALTI